MIKATAVTLILMLIRPKTPSPKALNGRGVGEKLTLIRVFNSALDVMVLQTPIFCNLLCIMFNRNL